MSSDTLAAQETLASLMPGDVREYLLDHPEFLADNTDLLPYLVPPHKPQGDKVQDFQQYMLLKLQDHYTAIKDEHDDLMTLMQEHLQRQTRINAAMLELIDAVSLQDIIDIITNDLPVTLDQEAVAILLEAGGILEEGLYGGLRVVPEGFVDGWLGDKNVELVEQEAPCPEIFGENAGDGIRSRALVRLRINDGMLVGMLALGHREAMYYATGLATEQLEFLGAVLERCFHKWISPAP